MIIVSDVTEIWPMATRVIVHKIERKPRAAVHEKRDSAVKIHARDDVDKNRKPQTSKVAGAGMVERIEKTAQRFDGALDRLAKR